MMNTGLILTVLSAATTVGNIATYYPKMMSNHATLRPRREQSLMVLALLLAIAGFFLQPGVVGFVLGAVAIVPAALFLLGTSTSGLKSQKPAVVVGAIALDFAALDADGNEFHLSDFRGSPVLLKFYRGYWCPYCVAELAQLGKYSKDFAALGVKLLAVSSDRVDELRAFKRKQNWDITLGADPELKAHELYNVQQRNFTPRRGLFRDLAIPTTILIDRAGRILWLEQAVDFRVRPQAQMVLAKTRSLLTMIDPEAAVADDCEVCAA